MRNPLKVRVRVIFCLLVFCAVSLNVWLATESSNRGFGSHFMRTFSPSDLAGGMFGFKAAHVKQNILKNISRPFLSRETQKTLHHVFEDNADAPLFDVLEETALYRLKCIMEKTDQLNTQVKRDQNQMSISSFPAKCEKSSTAAKQRPLKSSYPERNFQRYCTDNVVLKKPDFVTLGHIKPHIFLGIGIATVSRPQESYLEQTLTELFSKASVSEMEDVAVIVFLADLDERKAKEQVKAKLKASFSRQIDAGMLLVIEAPSAFYPQLTKLKRNFNDDPNRVYWRSKQCVDFSFIFSFAHNISRFYLHLEDDVITKHGYVTTIKETAKQMGTSAFEIEFSVLGFIAKMFRSSSLLDMAAFHLFNYEEMPVDMLQPVYNALISPLKHEPLTHYPSLFQHKGKSSSLKGKKQTAQDPFFDSHRNFISWKHIEISAFSNMPPFGPSHPENPLGLGAVFATKGPPKLNDYYTIYLFEEKVIEYVLIASGDEKRPHENAIGAEVFYSSTVGERTRRQASCGATFKQLGKFEQSVFAMKLTEFGKIGCIKVQFTSPVPASRKRVLVISQVNIALPGMVASHFREGNKDLSNLANSAAAVLHKEYEQYVARGYKYA